MSVSSVSAVSDALKYINGAEVTDEETSIVSDVKSSLCNPITAIFGVVEATNGLESATDTSSIKELINLIKEGGFKEAANSATASSGLSSTVEQFVKIADEKTAAASTKTAGTGIFSKIKSALSGVGSKVSGVLSKIPGVSTVMSGVSKASSWFGSTTFGKLLKGTGALGIMAFEGITGLVTEVIPAFKEGGVVSGFKQLAKTGVKTIASGLGWAGGAVAGSVIGGAIGSIFGPVGTIVGSKVGQFVGSMVGSVVATGVAKKITGKSETEKIEDEQYETAAQQVAVDSEAMQELNTLVAAQVQSEIADGTADEDTELMASYINAGMFSSSTSSSTSSSSTTSSTSTTSTVSEDIQNAVEDASYWSEMAEKAASGDTSIYDISDEDLEAIFSSSSSSSSSSSTTSTTTSEIIDYFG
ncbi:MAG: hypothetical protein LUE64_03120 [Candidatus Gastranaerophilales bacterium]|nr:hypothetical protein [Candidatus Gastranaerophilales bacterium]